MTVSVNGVSVVALNAATELPYVYKKKVYVGISFHNVVRHFWAWVSGKNERLQWTYIDSAQSPIRIKLQTVSWLPAAVLSLDAGPISKIVVPISHLDTKILHWMIPKLPFKISIDVFSLLCSDQSWRCSSSPDKQHIGVQDAAQASLWPGGFQMM